MSTAPAEVAQTDAVDAVLRAASGLLGLEVSFLGRLTAASFTYARLCGTWPGLCEGDKMPRADSFCAQMLDGAPVATSHADSDPAYEGLPSRARLGIQSYAAVPVLTADGTLLGTLGGIDRRSVAVGDTAIAVLRALADTVSGASGAASQDGQTPVRLRRTPSGWLVESPDGQVYPADDVTVAMVLADLLADDLTPGARPKRPDVQLDELERLRLSVVQLEHALASRVVVERAIGVLAERQRTRPREAFERLRRVARGKGRRVHDLARQVMASIDDPSVPLPPELVAPARHGPMPSDQLLGRRRTR